MASVHNGFESSDEDDLNEISNVLTTSVLGFIDEAITEEDIPTVEDSFVGGLPVWFNKDSPPPSELLLCKVCNSPMALLSQSFAPLEEALYDRIIYVFGCQNPSCRRQKGSIRVIRAVNKDPLKMKQLEKERETVLQQDLANKLKLEERKNFEVEATKNLFSTDVSSSNPFTVSGSTENPFASNPFSATKTSAPVNDESKKKTTESTFASVARKAADDSKPTKIEKTENIKLKKFPGYFIYVQEEQFKKTKLKDDVKMTTKMEELDSSVLDTEFDEVEGSSKSKSNSISENPESLRIASMLDDPIFGKFSETISYNSQQVLRYDLGGFPLLYSSKDDIYPLFVNNDHQLKVPNPGYNPSSSRQFELQLMPKLIMDLEKNNSDILNGMEWGTIIVCTDVEDFIPKFDKNNVGYVEEWCGVQWEEEVRR